MGSGLDGDVDFGGLFIFYKEEMFLFFMCLPRFFLNSKRFSLLAFNKKSRGVTIKQSIPLLSGPKFQLNQLKNN